MAFATNALVIKKRRVALLVLDFLQLKVAAWAAVGLNRMILSVTVIVNEFQDLKNAARSQANIFLIVEPKEMTRVARVNGDWLSINMFERFLAHWLDAIWAG